MFLPAAFVPITVFLFMNRIQTSLRASSNLSMASSNLIEIISKTRVVEEGYTNLYPINEYENGCYHRVSHQSASTKTKMVFGIFLPSSYKNDDNFNTPVMFWLSGLTCDDTNFAMKAGSRAFEAAEKHVSKQSKCVFSKFGESFS